MEPIYHIAPAARWHAWPKDDSYLPAEYDEDGFVHCTAGKELMLTVANRFYRIVPGDFVILAIDPGHLSAPLRWEAPADPTPHTGQSLAPAFPHIYGPIDRAAILAVYPVERAADGVFLGWQEPSAAAAQPVAPWEAHGPLRASANGHFLEHADGTGFFWLGDTAWHLVSLPLADVERYLDSRAALGFNVVQLIASNNGRPTSTGARPFTGDGPPWRELQFDETYWRHLDAVVALARARGLYLVLLPGWGGSADNPTGQADAQLFAEPDAHNASFGRLLGARYRDEPHVIWCACGEYHSPFFEQLPLPAQHLRRVASFAEGIRAAAGPHQLMTIHPFGRMSSSEEFHDTPWLDFNMIQSHVYQDDIDTLVAGDWERAPHKPTLLAEGWYEGEEPLYERRAGVHKIGAYDAGWIQRYQAYWAICFGSFGYSYGHRNIWMMGREESNEGVLLPESLDAPGSAALRHLRALVESYPFQARVPDQRLISTNTRGSDGTLSPSLRCATRANDGRWALVYSTRGEVVRLALHWLAPGLANAYWYNPRTGRWHTEAGEQPGKIPSLTDVQCGPGAPDRYFVPPEPPADGNDWVLALEIARTG